MTVCSKLTVLPESLGCKMHGVEQTPKLWRVPHFINDSFPPAMRTSPIEFSPRCGMSSGDVEKAAWQMKMTNLKF